MAQAQIAQELAQQVDQVKRQKHQAEHDAEKSNGITCDDCGIVFAKAHPVAGVSAESIFTVYFIGRHNTVINVISALSKKNATGLKI